MSNTSMTFSVKGLSYAESTKAKEAFDKISLYSKNAFTDVDPRVEMSIVVTNSKGSVNDASYARGVSDTHAFYMRSFAIVAFIFLTASFADEWHSSLSDDTKAQLSVIAQKTGILMSLASVKGQVMLGMAVQKGRNFLGAASEKMRELFKAVEGVVREKLLA
jgi:hypothetical protein